MKICFILEHFYPHLGGGENLFWRLSRKLVEKGIKVRVVTSNSGGLSGNHKMEGVDVYYYDWKKLFGHPIPRKKDLKEHVEWADIVHTATYTAAPVTLRVAKSMNKTCVITAYECLGNKWFWVDKPYRALLFFVFEFWVLHKNYTRYIAISEATKKDLEKSGIKRDKITVVYPILEQKNKVDYSAYGGGNYYLYYGRPGATKGIFILLKAIDYLVNDLKKDIKFTVVISNDPLKERNIFVGRINEWGLNNSVKVLPSQEREKLNEIIKEAKAIVVPSITEGFGYSAVEACELGKKVIISDGGSLPEVVFGKILTFNNRDYRDLADKIILAEKDSFKDIKKKDFDPEKDTDKLISIYKKIIV